MSILNKCCSFELFYSSYNPDKLNVSQFPQKYEAAKVFSTHDNNQKCFLSSKSVYYNDFWRSCDTEDWSNDAENTALYHKNKLHLKYIQIVNIYFKL